MTVYELIQQLSKFPANAPVHYTDEPGISVGLHDRVVAMKSFDEAGCKVYVCGNNHQVTGVPYEPGVR